MISSTKPHEPLAVTVQEAVHLSGIGRTRLYTAIADRELTPVKIGRRTLVLFEDLQAWLRRHQVARDAA